MMHNNTIYRNAETLQPSPGNITQGGTTMPFYDLHCADCGADSNISATIAEKMDKKIACPACGSNNMETIYRPESVHVKGDAAPAGPNSHICAGCRHGH